MESLKNMYEEFGICDAIYEFGQKTEEKLKARFDAIDKNAEYNQLKVLHAMQKNRVCAEHFSGSTGYGYNDDGRDTLEKVYADTFHTEDALVRPQITCGTHAIALALFSNLRPGDELLSIAGKPYDTLEEVIGIRPSRGSLAEYGVSYAQVDLKEDGSFDFDGIRNAINERTKVVTIQRSKGYQTRPTLSVAKIGEAVAFVKNIRENIICMVDNGCRCGYDGRLSDKESGRRTGTGRRLYRRKERMCGECSLPSDVSGTCQRGRSLPWYFKFFLSGIFSGTDRYSRSFKGCHFCSKHLRSMWISGSPEWF